MKKIAGILAAVVLFAAAPVCAEEWKYDAVLYGWLTGLQGDIGFANQTQSISASFDELVEYVDFAMAGHFEAKDPRFVVVTDIAYFNLGAERDAVVANQPVEIDMDLDEWIFELGGGYRVTPEIDLFLAGRWYLFEFGGVATGPLGSSSADDSYNWGDIYAGARYTKSFKEKWIVSVRGDIGTGGSEFAWFGNAALGYRFYDTVSAGLAWRVLSLDREPDVEEGDLLLYDVTQNGLGLGVGFSF